MAFIPGMTATANASTTIMPPANMAPWRSDSPKPCRQPPFQPSVTIRLAMTGNDASIEAKVREAFNPALYNKSKERVEKSHYFVKDFNPLKLGSLRLKKGRGLLRLTAPKIVGKQAIDVHSIELVKLP